MAHGKTIQFYRGTAAQATSANPVLAAGEPGFETDTYKFKIGDGTTVWNSLPYAKIDESTFVHLTGTETISGIKTFSARNVFANNNTDFGATGVNRLTIGNLGQTDSLWFDAVGTATDLNLKYRTKGAGTHQFINGQVLLPADPTSNLGAATKQYTDNLQSIRQYKTRYTAATSNADYIITPATAATGLQTALNAVNTAGGGILEILVNTTWTINTKVSIPSNVTVIQIGQGTLKKADSLNDFMFKNSDATNGNSNIVLQNIKIDGNQANQSSIYHVFDLQRITYCYFNSISVINSGSQTFRLRYSNYNVIEMCQGNTPKADTAMFYLEYGSSYNVITKNRTNMYTVAVDLDSANGVCKYNVVSNNVFENDNAPTYLNGDCILLVNGSVSNTIIGNSIYKYNEDGIRLSNDANYNTVVGNTLDTIGRYGISIPGGSFNTVSGNTIRTAGANGLFVDELAHDNAISNNTITSVTTLDGILLNPGTYDNTVNANVVNTYARYGIYINQSTGNAISNNKIDGKGSGSNGIYLLNAKDNVIVSNRSRNNTSAGFRIEETTADLSIDNIISSNRFYDNQSTKTQNYGIQEVSGSESPDYNTYTSNDVRGNKTSNMLQVGVNNVSSSNMGYADTIDGGTA